MVGMAAVWIGRGRVVFEGFNRAHGGICAVEVGKEGGGGSIIDEAEVGRFGG